MTTDMWTDWHASMLFATLCNSLIGQNNKNCSDVNSSVTYKSCMQCMIVLACMCSKERPASRQARFLGAPAAGWEAFRWCHWYNHQRPWNATHQVWWCFTIPRLTYCSSAAGYLTAGSLPLKQQRLNNDIVWLENELFIQSSFICFSEFGLFCTHHFQKFFYMQFVKFLAPFCSRCLELQTMLAATTTTSTILWPLYRSTCINWHL